MIKYYVAPLEGITGYVFRNVHHRFFSGTDKYFIPFIEPKPESKKIFTGREKNDILPEHNEGMNVVPQILTNKWEHFLWTAQRLQDLGYQEVNLNLGCPSKTVVSKNRGSGFLAYPDQVDEMLEHIFDALDMRISVKTRLGKENPEEFERLMEIYNKYPMEELIIHPRTQRQFYGGEPDYLAFEKALSCGKMPICFNGDLVFSKDSQEIEKKYPQIQSVMMGRGILRNPGLIRECQTGEVTQRVELKTYHDAMFAEYKKELVTEVYVLKKMKELWCYMSDFFNCSEKEKKALMKSKKIEAYTEAAHWILEQCELRYEESGRWKKA